ncbi:hypothetical protein [Fundidesulfovibrio soli]|uniref:hypothetical protein n=1 Tax=Fundidesulfovibrio soli TaxID=2922716 RepID=UPI001FB01FC3|nr:hypothetical protein [Fundidesulfovibrio soli]
MLKFFRNLVPALLLTLALCGQAFAAEAQGKWIHYGKTTLNANQHATVSLLNPIEGADEAKVAAMIKDAGGALPLVIAVQFSQPSMSFYTLNARVSDPKAAVEASRKASQMYKKIKEFLKSGETYLELGE